MTDIVSGVRRFREGAFPGKEALFRKLASGQEPPVLFVTCSDSRLDPHLFTSTEPGDLFVIRNAGNFIPSYQEGVAGGEQATLEYAVAVLGVQHIVVCGHSDCGAMKGLLAPESLAAVPSVASWLEQGKPVLDAVKGSTGEVPLEQVIEANALQQVRNLCTHPCVSAALDNEALSVHAWVFDIGSGMVTSYDAGAERFVELSDELVPMNIG